MVGRVTKKYLDSQIFPWCVNEAFPREEKSKSPYKEWLTLRSDRFAMGVFVLSTTILALLLVIELQASAWSWLRWLTGILAAIFFVISTTPLSFLKEWDDRVAFIRRFESRFQEVFILLEVVELPRPIHLMTVDEVRSHADITLTSYATSLMRAIKQYRHGSEVEVAARKRLNDVFDLFKAYGLTTHENWASYYRDAERRAEVEAADQERKAAEAVATAQS
jgi:hypothetical protein